MKRKAKTNPAMFNKHRISILRPLLALLVVLTISGCASRPKASGPIKYFYIDKNGKKVLDGIGYYGDSFHEGLAVVCDEYRDDGDIQPFRYIDRSGKTLFTISAYQAYPFSEGLAFINAKVPNVNGGCAGYIDKQGKWVLSPSFYGSGESFSDGLALVSTPDWKRQYIDHSGKSQIDASKFSRYMLRPFSEGRALVINGKYGDPTAHKPWQYGYIGKDGNWKIGLTELGGAAFCDGLAHRFWTGRPPENVRSIFVDGSGKELLELPYRAGNFSEGLCPFADPSTSFDSVSHDSLGGTTSTRSSKQGYCDRNGNVVIKPQYEGAREFSEGLAAVTINGKVGYIDKTGKVAVAPQFAYAGDFLEGLAVVIPFASNGNMPDLKLWGPPSVCVR